MSVSVSKAILQKTGVQLFVKKLKTQFLKTRSAYKHTESTVTSPVLHPSASSNVSAHIIEGTCSLKRR